MILALAASIPSTSKISRTWLVLVLCDTTPSVAITSFRPYPSTSSSFLPSSLTLITAREISGRPLTTTLVSTRLSCCILKNSELRSSRSRSSGSLITDGSLEETDLAGLDASVPISDTSTWILLPPTTATSPREILSFGAATMAVAIWSIVSSSCSFSIDLTSIFTCKYAWFSL
ncbi:hypothetical protein OGAPHI_001497 [Ogataea philodendri]|uniref:Uncharacterized protein n=1 Tax=Ogataea philodendri TaxID=1378263 RepID=A0A9P8T802_9ASCO|nr:uncharacterized protein OGAPHI_001497 [Ogataea philodendri]KAH3669376.1 hypothetical protein OGAPHI_001497 [Ogataea philodendri]